MYHIFEKKSIKNVLNLKNIMSSSDIIAHKKVAAIIVPLSKVFNG